MVAGYKHLSLDERIEIEKGVDAGLALVVIAGRIGRSTSTVSREVKRGGWRPSNTSEAYVPYRPKKLQTGPQTMLQYRAGQAERKSQVRKARSHEPYKMKSDTLVTYVVRQLGQGWTPEMISGRLGKEHGDYKSMQVSHETIYQWIYSPAQAHRGLSQYLPRGHKKRRKQRGRRVHSSKIDRRVSIRHRPAGCDDRTEFGHWEGDTVIGVRGGEAIHTEVERKTRYYMTSKVASVTSREAVEAQKRLFTALPPQARLSVTMDNGTEFHLHHELIDELGINTFFADPYSAYQRGTNEHHNGRLRRYLPKGTAFEELEHDELTAIIDQINNQPRKNLGWATPAEAFAEHLESLQATPVALRT